MRLEEKDVRAIVRLLGAVAVVRGDHSAKKRFLLTGLCKLIDADCWIWGLSCQPDPSKGQIVVSAVKEGFTDETFVKYLEAVDHPDMIKLASHFFVEVNQRREHLTRSRLQLAKLEAINRSDAIKVWEAADVGPTIMSFRPIDQISSSGVGVYRRFGRPDFTAREVRIVHIVLTEVPWLHEQGWPEDRAATVHKLSKRQRLALNLLTAGHNRKHIAAQMKISINTLHEYINDIYEFFGVHSQAELMSRFYEGNGHDVS